MLFAHFIFAAFNPTVKIVVVVMSLLISVPIIGRVIHVINDSSKDK
jgi:hypothetical protein